MNGWVLGHSVFCPYLGADLFADGDFILIVDDICIDFLSRIVRLLNDIA